MGRVLLDKPHQPHEHQELEEQSWDKKTVCVVERMKETETEPKEDALNHGPKKVSTTMEEGDHMKPLERTGSDDKDSEAPKSYKPPGLLATPDLQEALDTCRGQVERIAKDCRAKNRKFR